MDFLGDNFTFPDVSQATEDGLLAVGGDLSPERLLSAYQQGIFPWFEEDETILWWSPDPRFVLFPDKLKVSKSMKQFLKKCEYTVTVNKDFAAVIHSCSSKIRKGQEGTWITPDMIAAYVTLHNMGYAISVEVWNAKNDLVGGLYGVDLGRGMFCGESMFTKESNASKAGFITFIQNTDYKLIDCQVHTTHLESLGAEEMPRNEFLKYL